MTWAARMGLTCVPWGSLLATLYMAALNCISSNPSDPLKAGISSLETLWMVSGGLLTAPDTKYLGATTPSAVYIAGGRVFSSLENFLMVSGGLLAAPDTRYLGAMTPAAVCATRGRVLKVLGGLLAAP